MAITKNILGIKKRTILNRSNNMFMYMEPISEKEEQLIDDSKEQFSTIRFKTKEGFILKPDDIFLYGEVDLNNPNDIDFINKKDILSMEPFMNMWMNSNFNYDKNTITSDERCIFLKHDTFNKLEWFKFNYCLIGKPKRIIIYQIPKIVLYEYNARKNDKRYRR